MDGEREEPKRRTEEKKNRNQAKTKGTGETSLHADPDCIGGNAAHILFIACQEHVSIHPPRRSPAILENIVFLACVWEMNVN